ncbi:4-hydroxy-tetrahydrodipicolinate reductase [Flagellimonas sp. DF-77]|uniref:4-hydroxy-tetrahydrodipicolinate reductase n=1 Tax=Flagellimonas algarum TaxID=3230298 RepID=UPI0033950D76
MNIALFGYGKMGKMLEKLGTARGHSIVAKLDEGSGNPDFTSVDVAIDFSTPDAAFDNIERCFEANIPIISGTTGWLARYEEAVALCKRKKGAFIYASNFSLGVNLFFALNRQLAHMIKGHGYQVALEEIHHTQKLDAPSGTAISLAEGIMAEAGYSGWSLDETEANKVLISSVREGTVPGTHTIDYTSAVDTIRIQHTAHNREGFALGALIAAEWIVGKQGVFSMKDVLNLG